MIWLFLLPYIQLVFGIKPIEYQDKEIFTELPIKLNLPVGHGFLLGLNSSIALVGLDGSILSELKWRVDNPKIISECKNIIRTSKIDCHNLVRVIFPVSEDSSNEFIACGSYAYMTQCRTFFIINNKQISWRKSPQSPNGRIISESQGSKFITPRLSSSSQIYTRYRSSESDKFEIFTAFTEPILDRGEIRNNLYRFDINTKKQFGSGYSSYHINDEQNLKFLKISHLENHRKSFIFSTGRTASFVGQVCHDDPGFGYSENDHKWSTYVQAEITCSKKGTPYKDLVSVGDVFTLGNDQYFLAVFTNKEIEGTFQTSVVCVYNVDDIFKVLSGRNFKETLEGYGKEDLYGYREVSNPYKSTKIWYDQKPEREIEQFYIPGDCPQGQREAEREILKWQEEHVEINDQVKPYSLEPIISKAFTDDIVTRFRITAIVNPPSYTTDSDALVFYLGTNEGQVLKYALQLKTSILKRDKITKQSQGVQFIKETSIYDILGPNANRCGLEQSSNRKILSLSYLTPTKLTIKLFSCLIPFELDTCSAYNICPETCNHDPDCTLNSSSCISSKHTNFNPTQTLEAPLVCTPPVNTPVYADTHYESEWTGQIDYETDDSEFDKKLQVFQIQSQPPSQIKVSPSTAEQNDLFTLLIGGLLGVIVVLVPIVTCFIVKKCRNNNSSQDNKTSTLTRRQNSSRDTDDTGYPHCTDSIQESQKPLLITDHGYNSCSTGSSDRVRLYSDGARRTSQSSVIHTPSFDLPALPKTPTASYFNSRPQLIYHQPQDSQVSQGENRDKMTALPEPTYLSNSFSVSKTLTRPDSLNFNSINSLNSGHSAMTLPNKLRGRRQVPSRTSSFGNRKISAPASFRKMPTVSPEANKNTYSSSSSNEGNTISMTYDSRRPRTLTRPSTKMGYSATIDRSSLCKVKQVNVPNLDGVTVGRSNSSGRGSED